MWQGQKYYIGGQR